MKKIDFENIFSNNRFLKVFSLLIAVIAWFVVATVIDPVAPKIIHNVPITIHTTGNTLEANGLSPLDGADQKIDIHVKGKSYKVGLLKPEDFKVTVDLSAVTAPGEYTLEVKVEKADISDQDYEIQYPKPNTVKITFDRLVKKTFELEASVTNVTAPEGKIVEQPVASPNELVVQGPEGEISQIAKCVVENNDKITIKDSSPIEGKLVFYDANEKALDLKHISYKQTAFKITIPLYNKASLPLTFDYVNIPEGFDVSQMQYDIQPTSKLNVGIPVDAASSIDKITLGQIDFRKIDVGSVFKFDVSLLAGYINIDDVKTATITFQSAGMDSIYLPVGVITTKNVPAGYQVELVSQRIADVKLVGKSEVLSALTSADLVATVDLSSVKVTEGEQNLPVNISMVSGQQAWAVGQYFVQARIKASVELAQ